MATVAAATASPAAATPVTTFVSAFLDLREDRSKDKSFERCFALFDILARSGIPLHLFLSRSFETLWTSRGGASAGPNVNVEWIELEDLATYKEVMVAEADAGTTLALPRQRTAHHDTRNFMILMNSKAELVARAATSERWAGVPQFAWIDFSIAHVFQTDLEATLDYLRLLAHTRLRGPVIAFPGCWYRGAHYDNLFGGINWRFCGGFFIGDVRSVLDFAALYRDAWPRALAEKRCLTWEVNFWHWLECADHPTFKPTWFHADHNNTIVRVPPAHFHVVASLTTIPPRLAAGDCRKAIDSLLGQVDTVYLSVPETYERFPGEGIVPLPTWLTESSPYKERVVVVRPTKDAGPATKYVGGLDSIPAGAWLFVCDDDQEYRAGLVQKMRGAIRSLSVVQNHLRSIRSKTSGGLIHGYVGLLIPRALMEGLERWPLPDAARFVDDQWMSVYCHRRGVPIVESGIEVYEDIFAVLEGGWHEKLGVAALSALANREAKVAELAAAFGVRFLKGGAIQDLEAEG